MVSGSRDTTEAVVRQQGWGATAANKGEKVNGQASSTSLSLDPDWDVVTGLDPRSHTAESFRKLKAVLARREPEPQVIVITSPVPNDGKSFVTMNLALACASDPEMRTILIDADLRKPGGISRHFKPKPVTGITEMLGRGLASEAVIGRMHQPPLSIVPSAGLPDDPVKLFTSSAFKNLVKELRERYRRIIIDTPPVVTFVDADVVASVADGVLLVTRAGWTPRSAYIKAIESIQSAPILGTVLNSRSKNLADRHDYSEQYYYRYYRHRK